MSNPKFDFAAMPALTDFQATASWLAGLGWSEGAGGNMSVRQELPTGLATETFTALPIAVPYLAGKAILLTGSGTRAREIGKNPVPGVGMYQIGADGRSYGWLAGNQTPSMELPAHLAIHNVLEQVRPDDKAMLHTHPASVIALCHLDGFDNAKAITDTILRLQSEARLHLPEGIGFVKHALPGSLELGLQSAEAVKLHHLVLWQYHGCLATGATLAHATDLLEVFEKCVDVYWRLRMAGVEPDGISHAETERTLQAFGQLERYKSVF
ncbi:MAG: class II aldolase/adducin family protein [Robiginitomaculum sp.]|nr:class II aldolase/adducin family protein [Robiginitomaculum sp.]